MKISNKRNIISFYLLSLFSFSFFIAACSTQDNISKPTDNKYTYNDPYIAKSIDDLSNFCSQKKSRYSQYEEFYSNFYKTFSKEEPFFINSNKIIDWQEKTINELSHYFFNNLVREKEYSLPNWININKAYNNIEDDKLYLSIPKEDKYICKYTYRINIKPNDYNQELTNQVYYYFSDYFAIIRKK